MKECKWSTYIGRIFNICTTFWNGRWTNSQLAKIYSDLKFEKYFNNSLLMVIFYYALFSYIESNKTEVVE